MEDLTGVFGSRIKSLEILALTKDLKPVVRQGFYDHELPKVMNFCKKNKLHVETSNFKVKVLDKEKDFSDKGAVIDPEDMQGMRFLYLSKDPLKANMANYYELVGDHTKFGKLLGFPDCCVEFFTKNREDRMQKDYSYVKPALENSKGTEFSFVGNVMNRGNDYALLSHFPCSFHCKESQRIGRQNLKLLRKNYPKAAKEFEENLKGTHTVADKTVTFS